MHATRRAELPRVFGRGHVEVKEDEFQMYYGLARDPVMLVGAILPAADGSTGSRVVVRIGRSLLLPLLTLAIAIQLSYYTLRTYYEFHDLGVGIMLIGWLAICGGVFYPLSHWGINRDGRKMFRVLQTVVGTHRDES